MILPKLKQDDVDNMQSPLELDLIAFFSIVQEEVLNKLDASAGMSENDIIHEINKLFS